MGIGFVLISCLIVLSIAAAICSAVLSWIVRRFLKSAAETHPKIIKFAARLPFLCVVYAGLWFIAYAGIRSTVFHHDLPVGDSGYAALPDGYSIVIIDDMVGIEPTGSLGDNLIQRVRRLQIDGTLLWGTTGMAQEDPLDENGFFLIDTREHKRIDFNSQDEMEKEMLRRGVTPHLEPVDTVYQHYSTNWFDYVAGIALFLVPAIALLALMHRVWQIGKLRLEAA